MGHLNLIPLCVVTSVHQDNRLEYECICMLYVFCRVYMYVVCILPAGRGGADHRRTSQYLMGFASTNQASDAG